MVHVGSNESPRRCQPQNSTVGTESGVSEKMRIKLSGLLGFEDDTRVGGHGGREDQHLTNLKHARMRFEIPLN